MIIEFDVEKQMKEAQPLLDSIHDKYSVPDFSGTLLFDIYKDYGCWNKANMKINQVHEGAFLAAKAGGIIKADDTWLYLANGEKEPRYAEDLGQRMRSQDFPWEVVD